MPVDHGIQIHRARHQRLAAREGQQMAGQRRTALGGRAHRAPAGRAVADRASLPDCIRSILPSTTVSRLLKSCATPPVSWPTASIRCAWRSAASARSRSRHLLQAAGVGVFGDVLGVRGTRRAGVPPGATAAPAAAAGRPPARCSRRRDAEQPRPAAARRQQPALLHRDHHRQRKRPQRADRGDPDAAVDRAVHQQRAGDALAPAPRVNGGRSAKLVPIAASTCGKRASTCRRARCSMIAPFSLSSTAR